MKDIVDQLEAKREAAALGGGQDRIEAGGRYFTIPVTEGNTLRHRLHLYLPCRIALVLDVMELAIYECRFLDALFASHSDDMMSVVEEEIKSKGFDVFVNDPMYNQEEIEYQG